MLIKYYLSVNINTPFEDFALDLQNAWADPALRKFLCTFCTLFDCPENRVSMK